MIVPRRIGEDGVPEVDIIVSAAVPWLDAFEVAEVTRPLVNLWVRLRLIIRPSFDSVTLTRELRSDGVSPEIIVDDAARGAFHVEVAQSVMAAIPRNADGSAKHYAQFLVAEYPVADSDSLPLWRGAFVIEPGLLP